MGVPKNLLRDLFRLPKTRDVLYRLPWSVCIVCLAFLLICTFSAGGVSYRVSNMWSEGGFWQSYLFASIFVYAFCLCVCMAAIFGWKRRDLPGLMLILFFLLMLPWVWYFLLDKIKGFVIWPMDN